MRERALGDAELPITQNEKGLLLFLLLLVLDRLPLSWKKVRGGVQMEWIGYAMDMRRFAMGVRELRAAWVTIWLLDKAAEGSARLGKIREGLGRLRFIAGLVSS